MTSSSRSGTQCDPNRQEYKLFDPMCEPGLISILFLSRGRNKVAMASLESTIQAAKHFSGEIEWLFLEQGDGDDAFNNIENFNDFETERKIVILPNRNYGINNGLNTLWGCSRGEYVMIHESDWLNTKSDFNFLDISKSILDENSDIDIVQLRSNSDPFEHWGRGKPEFCPWSCSAQQLKKSHIEIQQKNTKNGHIFYTSKFPNGFNNNPCLIRKSLYLKCGHYPEPPLTADLRHGETEYAGRVCSYGPTIAHIGVDIYEHIGGARAKNYQ